MEGDEKVRRCHACRLLVYNLAAMDVEEAAERICRDGGGLHPHLYRRRDGTALTQDCPVGVQNRRRRQFLGAAAALLCAGSASGLFTRLLGGTVCLPSDATASGGPTAEVPALFREQAFTCATLAEAVNHYVALGEAAAARELASLAGHDEVGGLDLNERVGWVCRILFQPKGTKPLQPPAFGALALPYNSMPLSRWPLFPVALSGSTYFVLSEGYWLAGVAERLEDYLQYCRRDGRFREAPVPLPTRAGALRDLEQLRGSPEWKAIRWEDRGPGFSYTISEEWVWEGIRRQAERISLW
jgi:hypothetical protein